MANKKFSDFTTRTDTANVDFLVGYDGTTNVKIAPSNIGGGGGDDIWRVESAMYHSSNSSSSWYFFPINTFSEGSQAASNAEGVLATGAGYVSKIMFKCVHTASMTATSTRFRVEVNRSVVWTGDYISHSNAAFTTITQTLTSSDATFTSGDLVTIRFNTDGLWYSAVATLEYTYS
jgi:hypothetical protein